MNPSIHVPKFTVEAGGAAVSVEHRHFDMWKFHLPNRVDHDETLILPATSFDHARLIAMKLADALADAHELWKEAKAGLSSDVDFIRQQARTEVDSGLQVTFTLPEGGDAR